MTTTLLQCAHNCVKPQGRYFMPKTMRHHIAGAISNEKRGIFFCMIIPKAAALAVTWQNIPILFPSATI